MKFLSIILATSSILLSEVNASPVDNNALESRQSCHSYARTEAVWHENAMSRRRVYYETNKGLGNPDAVYADLGWKWDDGKEKCGAVTNNLQVFYHAGVTPGGSWVVDSNEVLGPAGDNAHECVLGRFRDTLARELGCVDVS